MSAWEAINNGVVAKTNQTRKKYWAHWTAYVKTFQVEPFLTTCNPIQQAIIITAFAARVRKGSYGRGNTIKVPSVANALAAISTTIELAGFNSPLYKAEGAYIEPVARAVEGWRRQDPASVPQLAVPVAVPNRMHAKALQQGSLFQQTVADLGLIAFYYLLRVGEYTEGTTSTTPATNARKRTVNFRVKDVGFFKDNKILPRSSSLETLLTADSCTLKITNQKNGRMGQTIHQEALPEKATCPIKALARRVHHILSNKGSTSSPICRFRKNNKWETIKPKDMIQGVRAAVLDLQLEKVGIAPDLVGVHSLRAGGAMAMKLTGHSDTTIMKHGRWRSLTFLEYIHNQIGHLSVNLSARMSETLPFTNIAAIEAA